MTTLSDDGPLSKDLEDLSLQSDESAAPLSISDISKLKSAPQRYEHLLLKYSSLTNRLRAVGLVPTVILSRAYVYELLGYDDLAVADAFVTYTLCESVRVEEWMTDLEPVDIHGEPWPEDGNHVKNLAVLCSALTLLCKGLDRIGATEDAQEKYKELIGRRSELMEATGSQDGVPSAYRQSSDDTFYEEVLSSQNYTWTPSEAEKHKFGWSRREIYPWNRYEPDRNALNSLDEINSSLAMVAPDLKAEVTTLPALNEDGGLSDDTWHQLGLFATKDLPPGTQVLQEKSVLTAIRPLDDALCDACGADLESVSRESMRQCPGEDCDTTFCSEDCASRARSAYHKPNIPPQEPTDEEANIEDEEHEEEPDSDYPPPHAPFCGNGALQEIGRTSTTTTPEFDLYFLLLTRTIQLSTTQATHPLSLTSTKYLWGDFNPAPDPTNPKLSTTNPKRTLPYSLHHNLTLPLQYFETLMHSIPETKPYSKEWLENWDWWIQATLYAKFRGVANAQQSTFDGKAEIAAVHPMWCLANHSCAPNVAWLPTGERVFTVRGADDVVDRDGGEWDGIREGEEIWSHYTDVRLPVQERRERLMEVLGGVCRCERCMREAKEI